MIQFIGGHLGSHKLGVIGAPVVEALLWLLARNAGIKLDFAVQAQWQPVDSQRLMLWARQFGKQEDYMTHLGHLHFEQRKSASHRETLLEAAGAAGLNVAAAENFLNSGELQQKVWDSYDCMVHEKLIHAIPLFVFNSPLTDGGPFRHGAGQPTVVKGSGTPWQFLQVLEQLVHDVDVAEGIDNSGQTSVSSKQGLRSLECIGWLCGAR